MKRIDDKLRRRERRKIRIRQKIKGTQDRPRMTIFKSNKFVYIQVIDDTKNHTLASASNREKELIAIKSTVKEIGRLGEVLGQRLKEKSISTIVFDRNGYKYHGVVKSIADGTRKAGIIF